MQYDCSAPRPTRPRNWCSWANPNRSAFSIIITEALGTFTPTSMTVVATMICASPETNRCIWASFSAAFILPCTIHTWYSGKASRMRSYPSSRFFRSLFSLS